MSQTRKLLIGLGAAWIGLTVLAVIVFGSAGRNESFAPEEEFTLHTWIDLPGTLDINKAVLYLVLSAILLGAIFTVHGPAGFFFTNPKGGWEFLALWIAGLAALALLGDGAFALRSGARAIPRAVTP